MKIAMINKYLPSERLNGVTIQVHLLANQLVRMGHEIHFFSFSPKPKDALYQVTHILLPEFIKGNKLFNTFLAPYYFRKANLYPFDVIHAHGDNFFLFKKKILRTFYGSALKEALHSTSIARCFSQLLLYFFEFWSGMVATKNIGISFNTQRVLPFISAVIPVGVDLKKFSPDLSKKTPFPSVLSVGTLSGRKRGHHLIQIFKKHVVKKNSNAELWVVHKGPQQNNSKNIKFFEHVSEEKLVELYQQAWVYCSPSSYEGFGVPYIEAMACGTPVICTPNDGANELFRQHGNLLIYPIDKLGSHLSALLNDKIALTKMRETGINFVRRFDVQLVAKQYLQQYEKLLQG